MSLYYVRLVSEICGEVEARDEQDAAEQMAYSIKSDCYDQGDFEIEEIERLKKE